MHPPQGVDCKAKKYFVHFLMVKKVERNLTTVQLCGERNLAMIFLQKLLNLLLGDEIT